MSDFSDVYNTPIPAARQAAFAKWFAALPKNLQNQHDYDIQGAFLNGSSPDFRNHLTDTFKKPNHPTFSDNSQYHGVDGYTGGMWTEDGFRPSQTNLSFLPAAQLQQYFRDYEPKSRLLPALPTPTPTGARGVYTMQDLAGGTPAAAPVPRLSIADLLKQFARPVQQ